MLLSEIYILLSQIGAIKTNWRHIQQLDVENYTSLVIAQNLESHSNMHYNSLCGDIVS